jgi:hypothetical protein
MENLERKHVHLFIRIERKQSHAQKKRGENKKEIHKKRRKKPIKHVHFFSFSAITASLQRQRKKTLRRECKSHSKEFHIQKY